MKAKLLLLEDDITLNETIVEYFEELGFDVVSVYDGDDAYEKIYENHFDVLILDVNVPSMNGFELLKRIRDQEIDTPAIFITSLNAMHSLEQGYSSGCDDYIRKPFALKELYLRVQSIVSRSLSHTMQDRVTLGENIYFDIKSNQIFIDEQPHILKNKEAKLLKFLLKNQDEILSHERIYDAVWEYDEDISETALRTYIKNIRKLIGKDKIVSIKKLGYRFTSE